MTSSDKESKTTENSNLNENGNIMNDTPGKEGGKTDTDNLSAETESADDTVSEPTLPPTPEEEALIWKDKYMRLSAEFDNYRKRTLKEKMDLVDMGGADVIKSLLPVLDDMDRAIESMHRTEDIVSVRSGIELIDTKLRDTLRQRGLREIEAVGMKLDTDYHEVVAKTPAADKKQRGNIVDVAQKGYSLKDKIIRHAKVVVGE